MHITDRTDHQLPRPPVDLGRANRIGETHREGTVQPPTALKPLTKAAHEDLTRIYEARLKKGKAFGKGADIAGVRPIWRT